MADGSSAKKVLNAGTHSACAERQESGSKRLGPLPRPKDAKALSGNSEGLGKIASMLSTAARLEIVNMVTLEELDSEKQQIKSNPRTLSAADRRVLLGGAIRLLRSRYASGRPILAEDITRMSAFADDARESVQ